MGSMMSTCTRIGRPPVHWARTFVPAAVLAVVMGTALGSPSISAASEAPSGEGILAEIEAPSAVVMDILTGRILLEKNADEPRYPASITKVMTLLLIHDALEAGTVSMDDQVRISAEAAGWGGTQIFLAPDEVMSFHDLYKAVAIASANDASTALAEHIAGSVDEFVGLMNERARGLGMTGTRFHNPHGIDDGLEVEQHHMTARDVAIVSREPIRRYPQVLELTGTWMDRVRNPDEGQCCELVNTNTMVRRVEGVDGLKTGFTSRAGYGIALTRSLGGVRFLSVVMGHTHRPSRDEEALRLLNWAFARWEPVPIIDGGDPVGLVRVAQGTEQHVEAAAAADLGVLVEKGQGDAVERTIHLDASVRAPVEQGQVLGRLEVTLDGVPLDSVDLVARHQVDRISLPGLWLRLLSRSWPWR